jgi:hypothetical protein
VTENEKKFMSQIDSASREAFLGLGPAAAIALVHGHSAANAISALAKEDPALAQVFAAAALDPRFVIEKSKCAHSARVCRGDARQDLRALFR